MICNLGDPMSLGHPVLNTHFGAAVLCLFRRCVVCVQWLCCVCSVAVLCVFTVPSRWHGCVACVECRAKSDAEWHVKADHFCILYCSSLSQGNAKFYGKTDRSSFVFFASPFPQGNAEFHGRSRRNTKITKYSHTLIFESRPWASVCPFFFWLDFVFGVCDSCVCVCGWGSCACRVCVESVFKFCVCACFVCVCVSESFDCIQYVFSACSCVVWVQHAFSACSCIMRVSDTPQHAFLTHSAPCSSVVRVQCVFVRCVCVCSCVVWFFSTFFETCMPWCVEDLCLYTYICTMSRYGLVKSHMWMRHGTQTIPSMLHVKKELSSVTHVNESRHVTCMNESYLYIYICTMSRYCLVKSHMWMSHGTQTISPILHVKKELFSITHVNESRHVTCMNESWHSNYSAHSARQKRTFFCHTWEWAKTCLIYEWVLGHKLFRQFCASENEYLLAHMEMSHVVSHVWTSHGTQTIQPILRITKELSSVTHVNEPCHVTYMNESLHTDYSAHSARQRRISSSLALAPIFSSIISSTTLARQALMWA